MRSKAFDRALTTVLPALRARARAMTRNVADADDLVQSTLERALIHSEKFQSGTDLRGWLFTIMRHRHADDCRTAVRAHWRLRELHRSELCHAATLPRPAPWQELEAADVCALLNAVPEPLRTTFELACLRRCSYADISRRLGVPLPTIGTRVMRARMLLRGLLSRRVLQSTSSD